MSAIARVLSQFAIMRVEAKPTWQKIWFNFAPSYRRHHRHFCQVADDYVEEITLAGNLFI